MKAENRGFTLIELLVALGIFAMMSVVAYQGLDSILATRERLAQENRKWQELAVFYVRFERDLASAVNRPIRIEGSVAAPALEGNRGDEVTIAFTRAGYAGYQGSLADTQRLGYRLRNHAVEQVVWPVLDRALDSEPAYSRAVTRVSEFELRYLDENGGWQLSWPVAGQTLPLAVELKIVLDSGEKVTRIFAL